MAVDSQLPLFGCRDFGFGLLCVAITQKQTFLLARAEENLAFGMVGDPMDPPVCLKHNEVPPVYAWYGWYGWWD